MLELDYLKIALGVVEIIIYVIVYKWFTNKIAGYKDLRFHKKLFLSGLLSILGLHLKIYSLAIITIIFATAYLISSFEEETIRWFKYGKDRIYKKGDLNSLISEDSLNALVDVIITLYKRKETSLFVITKKDVLDEIENTGYDLGKVPITQDFLLNMFLPESRLNKGAVIIRDNHVVSANSRLSPIITNEQIQHAGGGSKNFGMLGVASTTDAIVIGTSKGSGFITIGGTRPDGTVYFSLMNKMKEHDLQKGLTKEDIKNTLRALLKGAISPEEELIKKEKELEREEQLKERARIKMEKAQNVKTREQKIMERAERKRKQEED